MVEERTENDNNYNSVLTRMSNRKSMEKKIFDLCAG